jgi:phosphoglycerate dehydrogenase-like enzyme
VAILDDYQRVARALGAWEALGPDVEVDFFHDHLADTAGLVARLSPFDAVVAMRERTGFSRAVLSALPRLRLLVTTGERNAAIDLDAAREHGVVVSGTGGLPYPTAELTWGLLLALARNIAREDRAVREGAWQTSLGVGLSGKTLGLLGLGRLGAQVARIALAFGMRLTAYSQNLTAERAAEHGATLLSLDGLLGSADVVSIHLVLSERTRGLLGARELDLLKPGALLVNTSRGPIIEERALIDALESGRLGGAALDVFDTEPLPADHPLRRLPNTVLTPHLGYVTEETYRIFYGEAVEDILAFRANQPIRVL